MFEVKSRSVESWGPLANISESAFNNILNSRPGFAKDKIKKIKKLKTYKVTFKKVWNSDSFEIQAENEYAVQSAAKQYFKENAESIGFKEQARNQWADGYAGYDSISYVRIRS
jgi:cytochrome c peroxidase